MQSRRALCFAMETFIYNPDDPDRTYSLKEFEKLNDSLKAHEVQINGTLDSDATNTDSKRSCCWRDIPPTCELEYPNSSKRRTYYISGRFRLWRGNSGPRCGFHSEQGLSRSRRKPASHLSGRSFLPDIRRRS